MAGEGRGYCRGKEGHDEKKGAIRGDEDCGMVRGMTPFGFVVIGIIIYSSGGGGGSSSSSWGRNIAN